MMQLPINYNSLSPVKRRIVREAYIELQEGKCCYCGADLGEPPTDSVTQKHIFDKLFPPNFFKHPVHLHHDHDTGMTIGAVHAKCNAVLWQYHGQ